MEEESKDISVIADSIIQEFAELNLQLIKEYRQRNLKVAPEFFKETRENILFLKQISRHLTKVKSD